jgi:predicted component of type VI protein secretion system
MTTAEATFAQELIEMILRSKTISQEQQESYVDRILSGEFTQEMQEELATIFENEVRRLGDKISLMDDAITTNENLHAEEWQQIEPAMKDLAQKQAAETAQAVADYNAECNQAEREAEGSVEGSVREGEASEANAIRESLKQKPSESEQA